MIDRLLKLLDDDLDLALSEIDKLDLGNYRGMYIDVNKELIGGDISREKCRFKLKRLLSCWSEKYGDHSRGNEPIDTYKYLLKQDFVEQKTKLRENKEKKLYYVFLQGTPRCGLHYLIMQQHQGVSPKPIKASQIVLGEVERDIWEQIVFMLDLSIDVKSTQKDIPATIATLIELRLKEKPIVMVIFNVEDWGESYLYNLKKLISYLNKILIEGSKNSLYWYFLHTGAPELGEDEDLIVLPWVTEIAKEEVKNIFLSHESHFGSCEADIYPLFQVPKKLSDVIDIFLEHSSCKDELMQHFNKLQLT